MGWLFVAVAALLETVGVIGLKKYSETKAMAYVVLLVGGFGGAFIALYASFSYLQVSIAYAVWIGVGTASAVIINMLFFGESKSIGRIVAVCIIIVGVSGLKLVS